MNVNGSRVRNAISGTNDNFHFNGVEGNTEAVSTVAHGSNLIYNILGAGGDNIGQVKVVTQSPTRYYYLKDHLGSIKVTVNTSGTVVGYDDYYPYGLQMSGRSLVASEDGRYKFTGKELDSDEGLYYFGARYYDTWNARWLQVDPWVNKYPEYSPYNYCTLNPVRLVDSTGKGPGDFVSQWFQNEYNSLWNTGSQMIYNAAANAVHWGEGASEFGENLGDKVALFGGGLTVSTLIIPGAQESAPGPIAMTAVGLGLSEGSQIAKTGFLAIDAIAFDGSKDKLINEVIKLGVNTATDRLMDTSLNIMTQDLPPVLAKSYKEFLGEVKNAFGL